MTGAIRSRKGFYTTLWIFLAFTLTACSGRSETAQPQDQKAFKAVSLIPGPISDQLWNGGAYNGLLAIWDSLNAKISHIQTENAG